MKKVFLVGAIVIVLALGSIGAAFATGMNMTGVGALSLGIQNVPQINADYVGYHLSSAYTQPVTVDKVIISLDTDLTGSNAFSVSLRDYWGNELCYYAANDVNMSAANNYTYDLTADGGTLPTADQVYKVKVVAAQNSHYN
jgi:nitrogen fixation protein FixH